MVCLPFCLSFKFDFEALKTNHRPLVNWKQPLTSCLSHISTSQGQSRPERKQWGMLKQLKWNWVSICSSIFLQFDSPYFEHDYIKRPRQDTHCLARIIIYKNNICPNHLSPWQSRIMNHIAHNIICLNDWDIIGIIWFKQSQTGGQCKGMQRQQSSVWTAFCKAAWGSVIVRLSFCTSPSV